MILSVRMKALHQALPLLSSSTDVMHVHATPTTLHFAHLLSRIHSWKLSQIIYIPEKLCDLPTLSSQCRNLLIIAAAFE